MNLYRRFEGNDSCAKCPKCGEESKITYKYFLGLFEIISCDTCKESAFLWGKSRLTIKEKASDEDKQKAPEWVNKDGIRQCPACQSFKVSLELYATQLNKGYFYLKCECGNHENIKNRGLEFYCF